MVSNSSYSKISCLAEALEYAASSSAGLRIFDARGNLTAKISYQDLYQAARMRATQLQGLTRKWPQPAVIGLIAQTSLSFITDFFACQLVGLLPCPLPPPPVALGLEAYVRRTRQLLAAVQARMLLFDSIHAPLLDWFERFARSDDPNLQLIRSTSLPVPDESLTSQPLKGDAAAYIQLSSGTTHEPKGIQISQHAVCHNLKAILHEGLQIKSCDRAFSWLPLHHDMGLVGFLLAPLMGAVPLDLLPPQAFARRPQIWPNLMAKLGSTVCFAPSFAWGLAADRTSLEEAQQLRMNLRIAGVGGDMVRAHDLNRFTKRFEASGFAPQSFHPCYGLAEATLAVSMGSSNPDALDRLSSGKPLTNWEIRIVDDAGASLPALKSGHIHIRGPALMTGYWQEGLLSRLSPQAWFRTEDLGYLTPSGELVVTGRMQSLLLVRGRNVHAEAIESAICEDLQLPHGTVMAFQEERPFSAGIVIAVECGSKDQALRQQWTEAVRKIVFETCQDAAEILLVSPRTVKLTTSGKIARQMTLERLSDQRQ